MGDWRLGLAGSRGEEEARMRRQGRRDTDVRVSEVPVDLVRELLQLADAA